MKVFEKVDACPCCGGRPVLIEGIISIDAKRIDKAAKICCANCGLQIIKQSAGEAVEAWNKRTQAVEPGLMITELIMDALTVAASEWANSHPHDARLAVTLKEDIKNSIKAFNASRADMRKE